ncbi:TAXI family TRAP transporter solute-binding subunit [Pseudalkalibacillus sp. A8]|uniref:TAXI family TRAP transporter solute-binding subunit n=1 Tax=Pseudalkalibacillus sp. A8 TaxID=3382641 RepID=UPI0038B43D8F
MKRIIFFVSLILILAACGSSEESSGSQGSSQDLTITTGAQGGSWYPIGGALAELMNENIDGMTFSSVPGGGTSNPKSVATGKADIGFSYNSTLVSAQEGTDPYNKKLDGLKAVAKVYDMAWHVITPESSGITSFEDIAENQIRVNWAPNKKGTGDEWITTKVIEEYGFNYDDIESWGGKMNFVSISDGLSLWRDGHVNLYSAHTLPPQSSFIEATMSVDSNFLSISDKVLQSLNEKYGLVEATIPAGTYEGQNEDVKTVTMPMTIFAHEDVSEDVIYHFTKLLDEETEYLTTVHQVFKNFDIETAWKDTGIDLHPGAQKYYEEIGVME